MLMWQVLETKESYIALLLCRTKCPKFPNITCYLKLLNNIQENLEPTAGCRLFALFVLGADVVRVNSQNPEMIWS